MYPDPEAFKPDRFLNADGSLRDDPVLSSTYGFGRRICPGRYFVDSTLFIVIASLLSVFNIEKPKGTDGGPDAYPYTGFGITYGHHALFSWCGIDSDTCPACDPFQPPEVPFLFHYSKG